MRKSVLIGLLAVAALSVYADEPTYNFFDPADCDADGWLWLDTPEKIAKYVGVDKKIILVDAPYEIEDPEIPGEMITPETVADAEVLGYNTQGEAGGEGSKTGGFILPAAHIGKYGRDYYGGGILVPMPDCAQFDLYMSQELPNVYTYVLGAREFTTKASDCQYIWNYDDPSWFFPEDGPISTDYVAWDLNIQDLYYDLTGQGGVAEDSDNLMIYGPKGHPRTAYIANYSECPMLIQGLRIKTYTDVSLADTSVDGIIADADIAINGKVVSLSAPAEISVYTAAGVKVAGAYGTSLDCSALNGLYIVKAGNKAVKVNF